MKIAIPEDVVFRDLAGEVVLLNLASGTYFGLNEVGSRMWALLSEHQSTDKALDELLKEYDIAEPTLRADLENLVAKLAEKGLVKLNG